MFFNVVWPPNLTNIPACCVFLIQIIDGYFYLAIRWQSWETWFKTKKLINIPPPAGGGSFSPACSPAFSPASNLYPALRQQLVPSTQYCSESPSQCVLTCAPKWPLWKVQGVASHRRQEVAPLGFYRCWHAALLQARAVRHVFQKGILREASAQLRTSAERWRYLV